jgi:hypothetical protein
MATRAACVPEPQAGEWLGERLRPQLVELAGGLDERFVRGGNLLADAIETIRTLLASLAGINAALDANGASGAIARLRNASTRIAQLPRTIAQRDADLVDIARIVREVEGYVADIERQLKIIGIYGMNIKIAGADGDFRVFVDDMAGRLREGEGEIEIFARRLADVLKSVAPVRKAYAQAMSAQAGLSGHVHEQINACSARLERHLARSAALARRLETLAGRVQESVGGVLAAIQVADSTRQRIEHAIEAIDIVTGEARTVTMPGGARDHLARLIGSLIEAAGQEHTRRSHELSQSLARLEAAGGDLARLVDQRVAGDGISSLQDLEAGIIGIGRMTAQLGETATRADAMAGCIADATDDLTRRLDSIDLIVRDVKAIAINTRLLCLRHGQTGVAVAVIAVEVAAQASQLKDTAGKVAVAIDRLAALNQGLRGGAEHGEADPGAMLDHARAVIAQACQNSDAALADGENHVHRLMAQLGDAGAVVGDEDRLAQTLKPAATALAGPAVMLDEADEIWLRRVLPRIAGLYTMASERQVHAGFALSGMGTASTEIRPDHAATVIEQDDDGLF